MRKTEQQKTESQRSLGIKTPSKIWSRLLLIGAIGLSGCSTNQEFAGLSSAHWILGGIYLICVAVPSYLGAVSGYQSSEDPQQGAKAGAFQATFYASGLTMVAGIVSLLILSLVSSKQSAGLMAGVALVMFGIIGTVATAITSLILATLARFGAGLGARSSDRSAGIWAVILPALAVVLLMFYNSSR